MKVAQNCERGTFTAEIMIKKHIDDENLQNFESMVARYLEKLSEKRLDDKIFVEFKEISGSKVEIEGQKYTRISIAGECDGDVKNWKMRCQVNVVFLMESFRTRDMIKFEKVEEEGEVVDIPLTLGESFFKGGDKIYIFDPLRSLTKQLSSAIVCLSYRVSFSFVWISLFFWDYFRNLRHKREKKFSM